MNKVLVICGPTATGKTELALDLAAKYSGEIISADSRQVYIGLDIITGKDIPLHFIKTNSDLIWKNRPLSYFTDGRIRLWLTDVVYPHEPFNVSFFHDCASRVIAHIHARGKLPIIVGNTGLYIKSLTTPMSDIHVAHQPKLRARLAAKSVEYLFNYLNQINPFRAAALNQSDRWNPRRLIRAIEISLSPPAPYAPPPDLDFLQLGLCAPNSYIYERINRRVNSRLAAGAEMEVKKLLSLGYSWDLPGLQISGCQVWQKYFSKLITLPELIQLWQTAEHADFRQQLNWFKKQPRLHWLDVSDPASYSRTSSLVPDWYNNKQ